MELVDAVLNEISARRFRHVLLLSDLLAFDSILEIESPQARHCNAFVSESAMEQHRSLQKCEASPLLKSFWAQEEIKVLLVKEACFLLESELFRRFQSFGADILNLVGSELDSLTYDSI